MDNRIKKLDLQIGKISSLVSVEYVRVKWDSSSKKGYYISFIQEDREVVDIMEYFRERFKSLYPVGRERMEFISYSVVNNSGREVSMLRFYYRVNLFERVGCVWYNISD